MTTENTKLNDFKTQIENSKVRVKEIGLAQIQIEQVSDMNFISIKDANGVSKLFKANSQALQSLAKMLNIEKLIGSLTNSIGKESANKILSVIRIALSKNNKTVRLILNFETKEVVDVIEKAPAFLPANQFLELFESKLDANTEIVNFGVDAQGTQRITMKSSNWGFKLRGKSEEDYHLGMQFLNSPTIGTSVCPYFYRLICTNGMVAEKTIDAFNLQLAGTKNEQILEFVTGLNSLNYNQYDASAFNEKVAQMESLRASYGEILNFKNKIEKSSNIYSKTLEERSVLLNTLESYLPTNTIEQIYMRKGIDLKFGQFTKKHFANIKSEITCWDLLNNLTDFSSHDYGFGIDQSNMIKLQGLAGEYMSKENFDMSYQMPQLIK